MARGAVLLPRARPELPRATWACLMLFQKNRIATPQLTIARRKILHPIPSKRQKESGRKQSNRGAPTRQPRGFAKNKDLAFPKKRKTHFPDFVFENATTMSHTF